MENKEKGARKILKMVIEERNHQPCISTQNNIDKSDAKKYNFYRKPSIKKKLPEVKHTLTSYKRMLKANPLLKYEMEGIDLSSVSKQAQNSERSENVSDKNVNSQKSANIQRSQSLKNPKVNNNSKVRLQAKREANSIICGSQKIVCKNVGPENISKQSNIDFNTSTSRFLCSTRLEDNCTKVQVNKGTETNRCTIMKKNTLVSKPGMANACKKDDVKKRKPIRRSLSAQHFDRKRGGVVKGNQEKCIGHTDLTHSLEDISSKNPTTLQHDVSPIAEGSRESSLIFKTPSAYERRSIARFTPKSSLTNRRSLYHGPPLPSLADLQKRLNDWLVKRGKNLSSFHHLKCFGIQNQHTQIKVIDEENKENIEVDQDLDRGSYEDLKIHQSNCNSSSEIKNKIASDINVENITRVALEDLLKLIYDGYPVAQCEVWLELIRQKYKKLEEEPQYWECRAAIEQSRGSLTNAVQCYRTAIVQGAEIQAVDESLDILLQKFSLLNITTENANQNSTSDRARIVKDARNVFKSSIIQFAVQERNLKKNSKLEVEKKFVATPVRRSTRLSRSAYTSTPGVKICSSLQELETSDREFLDFKKNDALL